MREGLCVLSEIKKWMEMVCPVTWVTLRNPDHSGQDLPTGARLCNMNLIHTVVLAFQAPHDLQYMAINLQPAHRVF